MGTFGEDQENVFLMSRFHMDLLIIIVGGASGCKQ